jgi:hypothetical protein
MRCHTAPDFRKVPASSVRCARSDTGAEEENCNNHACRGDGRGGVTVCCFEVNEVGPDGLYKAVGYRFSDMETIPARGRAFRRQKQLLYARDGQRTAGQRAACCS